MVELEKVINGIKQYIEAELIDRVTGYQKWIVGAGASMILDNGANVFNSLKKNPVIVAMEIINSNNEIDVDKLYKYFLEQARRSAITFKVPIVGAVTLKADDVEKIYTFIKG